MDGTRHDPGTADGWARLAAAARPLDRAAADAARRRAVPWWVLRVAAPGLVTALVVLEYVLCEPLPCTVAEPCGPLPLSSLLEGLQLGAVAALWLVPRTGAPLVSLAAGGYWAGVYLADGEATTAAGLACLAQALLAAALTAWHASARRAPLPPAGPVVPLPASGRTRLVSTGLGTVEVLTVLALLLAGALGGWWVLQDSRTDAREARAVTTEVEVVSVDDVDWVAQVRVPGAGTAEVGLWDLEGVVPGARLPARVDASSRPPYVSLVSQPVEHDGWLVLAGLLGALGLGLGAHRVAGLRARARLLRRGGPVWSLPGGADDVVVALPTLGLAAPFARALPLDDLLAGVGLLHQELDEESATEREREWHADERAARADFEAAWRGRPLPDNDPGDPGDPDEPAEGDATAEVLLLGDPRPGGTVVAVLPDAVLAPFAPLAPLSPWRAEEAAAELLVDEHGASRSELDGDDGEDGDDDEGIDADVDEYGLPGHPVDPLPPGVPLHGPGGRVDQVVLRQSPWRHLWALTAVLLVVPWVLVTDWVWPTEPGDELAWWEAVGVFGAGLAMGTAGLRRARVRVVLDREGVHVREGYLSRSVAWWAATGTRVAADEVLVALGLDDEGVPEVVGGRAPDGLRAEAVAGAAERWRVDATAAREAATPSPRSPIDATALEARRADSELAAVVGALDEAEALRGRTRRLDPFLAGLTLLYGLAAAATLAAPLVP